MSEASEIDPDFVGGVPLIDVPDGGLLAGHVGETPALLSRRGEHMFAIAATCSHLGGPLAQGLIVGETVRCPWHHACFSLRTGEALTAPAFDPLPHWDVEVVEGRATVAGPPVAAPAIHRSGHTGERVVILGGGAAGFAALDMLQRRGFGGEITMVSSDDAPPYDRTLLTKDYLDGRFGDEHLPLSRRDHGDAQSTRILLQTEAVRIDIAAQQVALRDGSTQPYTRLLLATGSAPKRPDFPGAELAHVHTLRSLADCRAILAQARGRRRIVVVGGSFIGLEAAASLRDRGHEVAVVAPEQQPMGRIFGPQLAELIAAAHRDRGVAWHLGRTVASATAGAVTLDDGTVLDSDLVVVGIGVTPRTGLAEAAGLAVHNGVQVDDHLAASVPGIYAAGDIARWPDRYSGARIRVEHWVVAQRQGQTAALNIMGQHQPYSAVPFFWTKHFDLSIRYMGHAESWDDLVVAGDIAGRDGTVRFVKANRLMAVATVERDLAALHEERAWEEAGGPRRAD